MAYKDSDKIIKSIIYILTTFLISLILYNAFLLLNKNLLSKTPPKNSIRVSPISEKNIYNVSNLNSIYKVRFNNTDFNKLTSISKASIVYGNYNPLTESLIYSALFLDKNFNKDSSMDSISSVSKKDIPNITFVTDKELKGHSYNQIIDTISITNVNSCFSNFFYYNNEYHHFSKATQDTNPNTNIPITYKNIIIDMSSQKNNILYVYSGGLFREYNKNSKLFLLEGKIFWLTLDKDSFLYTGFANIETQLKSK